MEIRLALSVASPDKADALASLQSQRDATVEAQPHAAAIVDAILAAATPVIEAFPEEGLVLVGITAWIGVAHGAPTSLPTDLPR